MHKMSNHEFKNLERDAKGNIKDLYYWYVFMSDKQKTVLTEKDKDVLDNILNIPGYMALEYALGF